MENIQNDINKVLQQFVGKPNIAKNRTKIKKLLNQYLYKVKLK